MKGALPELYASAAKAVRLRPTSARGTFVSSGPSSGKTAFLCGALPTERGIACCRPLASRSLNRKPIINSLAGNQKDVNGRHISNSTVLLVTRWRGVASTDLAIWQVRFLRTSRSTIPNQESHPAGIVSESICRFRLSASALVSFIHSRTVTTRAV